MKNIISLKNKNSVKILQVSDPQDLKYVRRSMVRMLDRAYDKLNPDLVLFTGDNILGNHLLDARFGSRKIGEGFSDTYISMEKALSHILEPLENRSIPFAMIYGNHDDMNCITKEEQAALYRNYSNCMEMNTVSSEIDCDTYYIDITDNNDNTVFRIYMLDSAWQDKDEKKECHCEIKQATVDWLKTVNENSDNRHIPSLLFTHIPLPKILELTEVCDKNDVGAVPYKDGYIRLNTVKSSGFLGERPCVLDSDNGLYDYLNTADNIKAVVTGHDHTNLFEGKVGNLKFIQSGCASFRCYGNRWTRGVRLFTVNSDGTFTTEYYTYFDLFDNNAMEQFRYFWDSDEYEKKKFQSVGISSVIFASLAARKIYTIIRNYNSK